MRLHRHDRDAFGVPHRIVRDVANDGDACESFEQRRPAMPGGALFVLVAAHHQARSRSLRACSAEQVLARVSYGEARSKSGGQLALVDCMAAGRPRWPVSEHRDAVHAPEATGALRYGGSAGQAATASRSARSSLLARRPRDRQVGVVDRIERCRQGCPSNPPPPSSTSRHHVRTSPWPSTTNFWVVRPSRPTGPRACSLSVEMPISAPRPNS